MLECIEYKPRPARECLELNILLFEQHPFSLVSKYFRDLERPRKSNQILKVSAWSLKLVNTLVEHDVHTVQPTQFSYNSQII